MGKPNRMLILGGVLSELVAVLHIAIIIGGAEWYRFFGAGEKFAALSEQGSWIPGIVTLGIALAFFIWGLYAFSGAGLLKKLPWLNLTLILISAVYVLRGLAFIPMLFLDPVQVDAFMLWSSVISLLIGLTYAVGAIRMRRMSATVE